MIVIKLELWPGGNPDPATHTTLGIGTIANESAGPLSAYSVKLLKSARYSSRPGEVWKAGRVDVFPRADRRWGPWELLALALEVTIGDRVSRLKRYLATTAPVSNSEPISPSAAVKARTGAAALGSSPFNTTTAAPAAVAGHPLDKFTTT